MNVAALIGIVIALVMVLCVVVGVCLVVVEAFRSVVRHATRLAADELRGQRDR